MTENLAVTSFSRNLAVGDQVDSEISTVVNIVIPDTSGNVVFDNSGTSNSIKILVKYCVFEVSFDFGVSCDHV